VQTPLAPNSWGPAGMHQVSFEVATNAGMPFGPLNKVASGGELSRLLLAMKVVLHEGGATTSIFDEIDTGTGGAVAEAIGLRLRALAQSAQVIVVTHAPQVAALFIRKAGTKSVTTQVDVLDAASRREELARMLSGATISDEARKAAGKLLQEAV
jgi:DNA repair protein RecN (Recombination protein N)